MRTSPSREPIFISSISPGTGTGRCSGLEFAKSGTNRVYSSIVNGRTSKTSVNGCSPVRNRMEPEARRNKVLVMELTTTNALWWNWKLRHWQPERTEETRMEIGNPRLHELSKFFSDMATRDQATQVVSPRKAGQRSSKCSRTAKTRSLSSQSPGAKAKTSSKKG